MPSKNSENLKEKLREAAGQKDLARRGIRVAAVIAQALREVGQDPTLVGGAAVEFYTEGDYATEDIDMVTPGGPRLWEVMKNLEFTRRGKDFVNEPLKLYVEFPGESLGAGEKNDLLDVEGVPLRIVSIEDLVASCLCAYKFWKSTADGVATLLLLETGRADPERLKACAQREEVSDALNVIQAIYQEVFRKKLPKEEATRLLEEAKRRLR